MPLVVQTGGFWPTTLNSILQVALVYSVAAFAILAAGWRFIMRPHRAALDALAASVSAQFAQETERRVTRIKEMEGVITEIRGVLHANVGAINSMERTMERMDSRIAAQEKMAGRLDGQMQHTLDIVRESELARLRELGEVKEGLARMEAKLDILEARSRVERSGERR